MDTEFKAFFQSSSVQAGEVWESYQALCNISRASDLFQIGIEPEKFIYYRQNNWESIQRELALRNKNWEKEGGPELLNSLYLPTPPLLHPAFAATIAEALFITKEQLFQLAHFEASFFGNEFHAFGPDDIPENSGPGFIFKHLKTISPSLLEGATFPLEKAMISRIPILPLEYRAFLEMPGGKKMPGTDNIYFQLLVSYVKNYFDREKARFSLLHLIYKQLQVNFEYLITAIENNLQNDRWSVQRQVNNKLASNEIDPSPPENTILTSIPPSLNPPTYRPEWEPENEKIPVDSMWIDNRTCWVQFPTSIVLFDLDTKVNHEEHSVGNLKLCNISTDLSMIQLLGRKDDDNYSIADFVHFNYQTKKWHSGMWEGFFYKGLAHQTYEERALVDYFYQTKLNLEELVDYPAKFVISNCGQYVWIEDKHGNGGVYSFKSGLCQIYSMEMRNNYIEEITPVFFPLEWEPFLAGGKNEEAYRKLAAYKKNNRLELGAVSLKNNLWFVCDGNTLFENGKPILQFECPFSCVSFNRGTTKLLLGNYFGMTIVDVDSIHQKSEVEYSYFPFRE